MDSRDQIAFRDGATGPRAVLAGTRLDVWQVIETIRNSGGSAKEAAEYLGLPLSRIDAALAYYVDHREEVEAVAERERGAAERAEAAWRARSTETATGT